jgi:MFS family permease
MAGAIFLPNLLFSIGQGAILPVIPVVAVNLGSSLAGSGMVAAMLVVGALVADLPAGALVAKVGERAGMVGALVLASLGVGLALFAQTPWLFGLAVFVMGTATAVFYLARHAFMTTFVPAEVRARAMSTLGGTFLLGYLIVPFGTAWLIDMTGQVKSALWIQLAGCLAAGAAVLAFKDPEKAMAAATPEAHRAPTAGLFRALRTNRRTLATVGTGAGLLSARRAGRQVLLPMWGLSLGLGESYIAVVIGIAGVVDCALFYTGGWLMDRFGRMWVILPCQIAMGVGYVGLSFTHDWPAAAKWFVAGAVFLSLANGIGSGILILSARTWPTRPTRPRSWEPGGSRPTPAQRSLP